MSARAIVIVSCLLGVAFPAAADVLQLRDGSEHVGGLVGRTGETVEFLTEGGERLSVPAGDVACYVPGPRSAKLERRLPKAQLKFFKQCQREAERLLKKHARAKAPEERAPLELALAKFSGGELLEPLGEAIESRSADTRRYAVLRLRGLGMREAVHPLVKGALLSKEELTRQEAHQAALAVDAALTERYYLTTAMAQTKPVRRVRAIDYLGTLPRASAVPSLTAVVERVGLEIRAELAKADNLREVPVNLGTIGNAAANVNIELPAMSLISVSTSISVDALRAISGRAVGALERSSGQGFGDDVGRWKSWWAEEERKAAAAPTGG